MTTMDCKRCGCHFDTADGYAGICLTRGRTAFEQLENTITVHVCDDCSEILQAWVGIVPVPPSPEPRHEARPHPQPFSCADERLDLT